MKSKKIKMNILMKSGAKLSFEVDDFSVGKANNQITNLSWEGMDDKMKSLYINLDEIAAVYKG